MSLNDVPCPWCNVAVTISKAFLNDGVASLIPEPANRERGAPDVQDGSEEGLPTVTQQWSMG